MMASLEFGCGRGRGRGRRFLSNDARDDRFYSSNSDSAHSAAGDAVDGCVRRNDKFTSDFHDRFSDGAKDVLSAQAMTETPPICSSTDEKYKAINASNGKHDQIVSIKILSVDLAEKLVEVTLIENNVNVKRKVCLHETSMTKKWKEENQLIFKSTALEENALLSALEMNLGGQFLAHQILSDEDEESYRYVLSIDVFSFVNLASDFVASLIFMMIPRLPTINLHKLCIISNLKENDEIDIVMYNHLWMGLREQLHELQIEKKLFGPPCPASQDLHKEMLAGYNLQYFLAPFNDDWSELHRVKIIGLDYNNTVRVLFVDLGKQVSIPISNLALPFPTSSTPQLLDKIPPQAITVRVDKLHPEDENVLRSLRSTLESRVCYVQTLNDSKDAIPPLVNIFVANSQADGTISLAELVKSCSERKAPIINTTFKQDPLKHAERKLEELKKKIQGRPDSRRTQ